VEEFPTAAGQSRIERLEPGLFRELRRWVGEVVGDRVRAAQEPRPR
jgi:hypothetical protein